MRAGCTIVSPNYLPFARTLASSYRAQHPDQRFFVLIVADTADPEPFRLEESFTPVALGQIGIPNLRAAAMRYDILELKTNVKPTFLRYLLETEGVLSLVYLDPDILVYRSLEPVFAAGEGGASAVLTPHMTAPVLDGRSPSEQDLLYNGTFNLGFIAVGGGEESRRLLCWWEERCLQLGFSEGRTGLFVDQKWMNLAPGFFDRVVITRDPGLNMAYWNLHERTLVTTVGGTLVEGPRGELQPLRFFHFSGLELDEPDDISRNTDRFRLADRPDLELLFQDYRNRLRALAGHPAEQVPYGFDRFSDGTTIYRLTRRLFAAHESHFGSEGADPFRAEGPFAAFARAQGLTKGKASPQKASWKDVSAGDRRVEEVHRLLRLALRLLGPGRYELLMRYLSYISVLRHQGVFLRDGRWPAPAKRSERA